MPSTSAGPAEQRRRPQIAFFDYPDVYEDFYPHYGVNQQEFATTWAATACHQWVKLIQDEIGDVTWYSFSLAPQLRGAVHQVIGCEVRFLISPLLHRKLWSAFYESRVSYRLRKHYRIYEVVASYLSLTSWELLRALRTNRPDFIFVQDYAYGRYDVLVGLARALRIPLVTVHTGSKPEWYVAPRLKKKTIPAADRLIASSDEERALVVERFGADPARVRVIPTPIDTDTFTPLDRAAARSVLPPTVTGRVVLFVGRLDRAVKRVDTLIEAFASVARDRPDIDLVIVGDGPDREVIEALAKELRPGRIHFLGWVSQKTELAELYNCAELLVLPSRSEGLPTVVAEALACGTPVLASDLPGVRTLIDENQTGWTIPPADREGLTGRLHSILGDDISGSMRARCREVSLKRVSAAAVAPALRAFWPPLRSSR